MKIHSVRSAVNIGFFAFTSGCSLLHTRSPKPVDASMVVTTSATGAGTRQEAVVPEATAAPQGPESTPTVSGSPPVFTGSRSSSTLKTKRGDSVPDITKARWEEIAGRISSRISTRDSIAQRRIFLSLHDNSSDFDQFLSKFISRDLASHGATVVDDHMVLTSVVIESYVSVSPAPVLDLRILLKDKGDVVLAVVENDTFRIGEIGDYLPKGVYLGSDHKLHDDPRRIFPVVGGK